MAKISEGDKLVVTIENDEIKLKKFDEDVLLNILMNFNKVLVSNEIAIKAGDFSRIYNFLINNKQIFNRIWKTCFARF